MCYPKEEDGLGIKDIKVLNSALLQKWKWRIIKEKNVMWSSLLRGRYRDPVVKVLIGDETITTVKDSIWWMDLVQSGSDNDNGCNLFSSAILMKVNNGKNIVFWQSKWMGGIKPSKKHSRRILLLPLILTVEGMISWNSQGWTWNLVESLETNDIEYHVARENLLEMLQEVILDITIDDIHEWNMEADRVFKVRSCYNLLMHYVTAAPLHQEVTVKALRELWKTQAPPKLKFFGWRVLINRIYSKDNLINRSIILVSDDSYCVFCVSHLEMVDHIFASCPLRIIFGVE